MDRNVRVFICYPVLIQMEKISYEMVFGASNIIGDIKDAIDNAFEEIERIEKHGNKDIKMVEKTALSGFYNKSEIDFIKKHIIPEPGKSGDYEIAYGVFLATHLDLIPQV